MKKIFIILILLLTTACNDTEKIQINNDILENDDEIIEENIPTYVDDNPIKIGLYENNKLVKSYQTTLGNHKDIGSFYVYYTNIDNLSSSNAKTNWNKYYKEYNDIDKYKIGFNISFTAEDKQIDQTIINPTGMYSMSPYLFVYLYDDIHQSDGSWYSHLKEDDMTNDTILSSIKLYLAGEGDKITSPISLTVFTYDSDDFDEFGKYRGISSYTVNIETK